ncbi:hypothetical protein [Corynebacterium lubricantis]|uniref:hypothetical protein n=1 Tax=Corynebacterium lubricantis TaxID=541095 RepID=UPI0003641C0D|nr:hypothetical protein [Corynebacterium lubricantis]
MARIEKILQQLQSSEHNVRYQDLEKVCDHFFERRPSASSKKKGTSHRTYKTPWVGDPRVNIQEGRNGKAKPYQVRQVLQAIEKIQSTTEESE